MAETSGFFNAHLVGGNYDRTYLAEQFAKYFASFIGNGIFGGKLSELMVVQHPDAGMKVSVLPGMSWINGFWYENSSDLTVDIEVSDGIQSRVDNVVVRWGNVERKIWVEVVKGTLAPDAIAPALERNSDYYDLKIAEIHVEAGLTSISQANIIDTRFDNEVCGLVTGLVDQIDATEYKNLLNSFVQDYTVEFKAFLESLESQGTDALNDLINQFDNLFARLNALVKDESAFATLALKADGTASETALLSQTLGYTKKNLISYPYGETTHDQGGISWVDNKDGTVTANGISTTETYFVLYKGKMPSPGKYFLTDGVDVTTSHYIYALKMRKEDDTVDSDMIRGHSNIPFEITESDVENYNLFIAIVIERDITVQNVTFKPMLRRAEILDATWEPYRLSVDELLNRDYKYGVEYATNEIWNGKRVYQKTFYVASLPNKSTLAIEVDCIYTNVIHVSGFAIDSVDVQYYQFPIILNGFTPIAVISNVMEETDTTSSIIIRTNEDVSAFKGYITIRYVKD